MLEKLFSFKRMHFTKSFNNVTFMVSQDSVATSVIRTYKCVKCAMFLVINVYTYWLTCKTHKTHCTSVSHECVQRVR